MFQYTRPVSGIPVIRYSTDSQKIKEPNRFTVSVTCTHILTYLCVCERKLIFWCRVLSFIFYWFGLVRRKLTIPEMWQAVGMHYGGFSHRRVAVHFRVNHSIIVPLMQRFRQTGNVTVTSQNDAERGPAHIQTDAATVVAYSWCTSW